MNYKNKELFILNLFFLATICVYFVLSAVFYFVLSDYAVVPVDLILLIISPVFFLKIKKFELGEILKFNKIGMKALVLVLIGAVFTLLAAQIAASFASNLYSLIGKNPKAQIALKTTKAGIVLQFFATALFVPFAEEFFFRGFMQGLYKKLNIKQGILISALLFALVHVQFHIVVGTFFAAVVWGYFAKYTKSIFSSIISHIIFNFATLFVMYHKPSVASSSDANPDMKTILSMALAFVTACGCIFIVLKLLKKDFNQEPSEDVSTEKDADFTGEINTAKAWSPLYLFAAIILFFSVSLLMN
jgi:membrane protease YdiL (CAAX protease family)